MILWVVALRPEAAPLIEARGLEAVSERTPWPLYRRDESEALVISGVGRNRVARACAWVRAHLEPPLHAAWLNAGIAGHSTGPVGRALLAYRVVEPTTGNSWFPPPLPGHRLAGDTVYTVDQPETEFARPGAYDMEASGFLATTARWATSEVTQVVKVISDSPDEPASQLDRKRVEGLIGDRVADIESVADALSLCSSALETRYAEPSGYESLVGRWHFTVTQRRQLRRALERHAALSPREVDTDSITARDAGEALRQLNERVEALGVEI